MDPNRDESILEPDTLVGRRRVRRSGNGHTGPDRAKLFPAVRTAARRPLRVERPRSVDQGQQARIDEMSEAELHESTNYGAELRCLLLTQSDTGLAVPGAS